MEKEKKLISKFNKNRIIFGVYLLIVTVGMGVSYVADNKETNVLPVYDKCVVIDSGHGGWDPGKVSGEVNEKDINLQISMKLKEYLEQGGCFVTATREDDISLGDKKGEDLRKRKEIINADGNDLLVSIHQNAYSTSDVKGAQVFYHEDCEESKRLGECIQKRLKELDESNDRQAKGNDSYYILRGAEIPAVIVECGFLSNEEEKNKLTDEEYQQKIAWCIYKGIIDYYTV